MMNKKILDSVEKYYTEKILQHGVSAKGVDWNSEDSQELRFLQLMKVVSTEEKFSILDYGCGYGGMYEFIKKLGYSDFNYLGFDISEEMVKQGKELHQNNKDVSFASELKEGVKVDYTVASGIFNVRLENDTAAWEEYILNTIRHMDSVSTRGFSFNMLTSYSDKEYMKDYLHYPVPEEIFGFCKKNFSRNVALLHDYNLYEFTIIVRK